MRRQRHRGSRKDPSGCRGSTACRHLDSRLPIVCCFKTPSLWFFVMGPPIHRVWLDLTGFQRARPEAAGVRQVPCSLLLNPKPVFPSGIPALAFKGILCMARLCGWLGQTQPWTQLRSETSAFGGNQHSRLINDRKAAREALRVPWV